MSEITKCNQDVKLMPTELRYENTILSMQNKDSAFSQNKSL
jgi:hypothetical protein